MVRGLGLGLWGVCASGVVCCLRLSIRDGVCERLIYFVSRDRSASASRSVVLRVEIGRIPRRDRSSSASRSVQFRVEIGPLPHRNRLHSAARLWCVRTSESRCVLRVWLSSVLHMGDQGFGGVRVGSCWNDGLFRRSWCMTVGLPCAVRGVCAHGSRTVAVTDVAVPHDSAVSADVGSA